MLKIHLSDDLPPSSTFICHENMLNMRLQAVISFFFHRLAGVLKKESQATGILQSIRILVECSECRGLERMRSTAYAARNEGEFNGPSKEGRRICSLVCFLFCGPSMSIDSYSIQYYLALSRCVSRVLGVLCLIR